MYTFHRVSYLVEFKYTNVFSEQLTLCYCPFMVTVTGLPAPVQLNPVAPRDCRSCLTLQKLGQERNCILCFTSGRIWRAWKVGSVSSSHSENPQELFGQEGGVSRSSLMLQQYQDVIYCFIPTSHSVERSFSEATLCMRVYNKIYRHLEDLYNLVN